VVFAHVGFARLENVRKVVLTIPAHTAAAAAAVVGNPPSLVSKIVSISSPLPLPAPLLPPTSAPVIISMVAVTVVPIPVPSE
jgi:hypothetical protein